MRRRHATPFGTEVQAGGRVVRCHLWTPGRDSRAGRLIEHVLRLEWRLSNGAAPHSI